MPPPRGGGDIPGKERSMLSKAKRRGDAIEFKEDDFAKWVTGAHKRKVERQRTGHKEAEQKVRMSKNAEKREEREKMRQLVKQHFGDIQIDQDGRVLTSNYQRPAHLNEDEGYSSEEEYLIRKHQEHEVAEKKRLYKESQELQKKLPKWAKGKEEFLKDDSIVKEQNESFLTAQYSFNTEDNIQEIASKATKNKLLKNLEEQREIEREALLNASTKSNVMNFENDDSMVTVETSAMNIDTSSIVSRRSQRDLALLSSNTTSIQDLIGKRRAAAREQAKQHHTMDTSSTSSSDSDDDKPHRSTRQQSNKKQVPKKTNHKKEKKIKPRMAKSRLGLLRGEEEEDNDALDDTTEASSSDFDDEEEEEDQVVTVVAPKASKSQLKATPKPSQAPQLKQKQTKTPPTKQQPQIIAPIIVTPSLSATTISSSEEEEQEEEWQVLEEEVINHAISSSDDDDKIFKRRELARISEEKKSLKKTQLELDRREKDFQAAKLDKSKSKKQRVGGGALDSEFNATVQLAQKMADDIVQLDIDVTKQAKTVAMAEASAWFMLPKPEAWDEADERKKRLLEQRLELQLKAAATSIEANRTDTKPGSKLTNLEVMELDPTYGWDEGESSNDRDLGAILGIPAASMGGRFRKKPLSEKNKYRSSDARKAKKQEKTREKEKVAAMAFESGFADMNTKGRGDKIKWDSDDEGSNKKGRKRDEGGIFDDFGKESYYLDKTGAKKQRQAGDRVPEGGVNRKDRKRQEIKDQRRLEGAHKRGKMIRGKYFFGAKAGAVTL